MSTTQDHPPKRARLDMEELERSTRYYDEKGDIEIISSDLVLFKLPAYRLQASSAVFRAMIDTGTSNAAAQVPIELDDKETEHSTTLTGALDIVYHSSDILAHDVDHTIRVVKFLRKYEFDREVELIRARSCAALAGKWTWNVFVIGCHLEDHDLCGRVLKRGGARTWGKGWNEGREEKFGDCVTGATVYDLGNMSQSHMESIPMESLWALARALKKVPLTGDRESSAVWTEVGDEYVRLMRLRDASKGANVNNDST